MADKLSTEEILALCRKTDGGGAAPAAEASEPESAPAAEAPAEKPKAPAVKPSSTADILAAARAQGAGDGGAKEGDDQYEVDEAEAPAAAPKKPIATPGSTADILAAARAQGAAGAAPKAAAKPAAAKKPAAKAEAKPAAPAASSGLSVQEMLKGMREGKPEAETETAVATAAAPATPAKPKLPPKLPRPAKDPSAATRRGVLFAIVALVATPFALAWTTLAAIAIDWTLYIARFMFPNVLVEPPTQFKIGPPGDYPLGTVSTKWKALRGIWIVHTDSYKGRDLIYALASVCTHLGCTPNWLEAEQKFKCPCHGSGFYANGINFEGPAPRPLERVGLRIAEDGSLEVDKSVKFQEEMGQWEDAASFVDGTIA